MGKFKVSFTTALFVFSFIICVIVAVAFVDRAPKNDYDSFYEDDRAGENRDDFDRRGDSDGDDDWGRRKPANPDQKKSAAAESSPTADEANLVDLPVAPHLADSVQQVATPPPAAVVNPMQGRDPEDIARALMGKAGIDASIQASTVPGLAVPPGMTTPVGAGQQAPAQPRYTPAAFLPLQSNIGPGGGGPPGMGSVPPPATGYQGATGSVGAGGLYATPSLGNSTNAANKWDPVQAKPTASNMVGVRSLPGGQQDGMMISDGRSAPGAAPPPGYENVITQQGSATPGTPSSAPPSLSTGPAPTGLGGLDQPLLLAPQPQSGAEKWDLPPAPTLRPPPIQDPDRRRSDAESEPSETETPDSLNPDGSSGQALAVSGDKTPSDEPAVVARVKEKTLTMDQALRLAEVSFKVKDKTLTADQRKEETKKAATVWEEITLAAAVATETGLSVSPPDVERYASMRPDFEPADWQVAMNEKGFSEKEIRENLSDIALSEKLVEQQFEKEIGADEIRKAYEKKPSQYATKREVHLREIFKEKPEDDKQAEKIIAQMRRLQRQAAGGTDFGLLARQASQAPTKVKSGDLGWITPEQDADEERDSAISKLKPGEVTEVLEEPAGYRIYKLVDVREAKNDFEGGKDLVVAELKTPIRETCFEESREKLESGELVKEEVQTASSEKVKVGSEKAEVAVAPETAPDDQVKAARRERAQQVMAEAARLKNAAKRQQLTEAMPQEPGAQNQVLYAPGTQVQQMAGGQPPPAYQAGGQPAAPVQNPLSMPESVSVNYPPGTTNEVSAYGQNSTNQAAWPAGSAPMDPNAALQAAALQAGAQAPPTAAPTPESFKSNGWVVTKSTEGDIPENRSGAEGAARTTAEPTPGNVPSGFEGSSGTADSQPQRQSKGLVGSVKSFLGGFRK